MSSISALFFAHQSGAPGQNFGCIERLHLHSSVHIDAALTHLGLQIQPAEAEDEERVDVDTVGHHVKHGGEMLAHACSVRARAGKLHGTPASREKLNVELSAEIGDAVREFAVHE